ncbi:ankyrin repeat-containing domain protein, partial [Dactylonectria macrodidyma]
MRSRAIEAKDRYSQTPLRGAAGCGHEAVVKLLLLHLLLLLFNAGGNRNSQPPEGHRACVVKLLLGKGADVDAKSEDGRTPLLWAVNRGHVAVVELLLEKSAEIESEDGNGQT